MKEDNILLDEYGHAVISDFGLAISFNEGDPENFDAELGRKIARQNAVAKVWPLMGYELRSRLAAS